MAATFLPYLVAFGWVSVFMLISVFLRAKIPFLQENLAPASIIAGILGFIAINLGLLWAPTPDGAVRLTPGTFGVITFHLFAIGFVGIGLLKNKPAGSDNKEHAKIYWRGSLWIALVFTLSYALQSTFGYAVFEELAGFDRGRSQSHPWVFAGGRFTQGQDKPWLMPPFGKALPTMCPMPSI